MSSLKYIRSSIFWLLLALLVSCGDESASSRTFPTIDLAKTPLIHYPFAGALTEAPVNFVEVWNRDALRQLGLAHITLYSKGGKNPEDTLEKIVFDYSANWEAMDYSVYRFDETPNAWTTGKLRFTPASKKGDITFSRHFGINKPLKTDLLQTDYGYLLLRHKPGDRIDTTWLIGSFSRPQCLIAKIGKSIFSIDLYMPEGSSTNEIIAALKALPVDSSATTTAQCTVIFVRDGRPQEAFLLNETYSQVARTRSWTYTDQGISTYQEWLGSSVIKDMKWHYGKSQLPERVTIDRKMYFYRYE